FELFERNVTDHIGEVFWVGAAFERHQRVGVVDDGVLGRIPAEEVVRRAAEQQTELLKVLNLDVRDVKIQQNYSPSTARRRSSSKTSGPSLSHAAQKHAADRIST